MLVRLALPDDPDDPRRSGRLVPVGVTDRTTTQDIALEGRTGPPRGSPHTIMRRPGIRPVPPGVDDLPGVATLHRRVRIPDGDFLDARVPRIPTSFSSVIGPMPRRIPRTSAWLGSDPLDPPAASQDVPGSPERATLSVRHSSCYLLLPRSRTLHVLGRGK